MLSYDFSNPWTVHLIDNHDSDNICVNPHPLTKKSISIEFQSFGHYFKPYRLLFSLYTKPLCRQHLVYISSYSSLHTWMPSSHKSSACPAVIVLQRHTPYEVSSASPHAHTSHSRLGQNAWIKSMAAILARNHFVRPCTLLFGTPTWCQQLYH